MAVTEIMVAARSDHLLGDRLPDVFTQIQDYQLEQIRLLARRAGLADDAAMDRFTRLSAAAIRGLTIERMFKRDQKGVEDAMALLQELKVIYTDRLTAEAPTT